MANDFWKTAEIFKASIEERMYGSELGLERSEWAPYRQLERCYSDADLVYLEGHPEIITYVRRYRYKVIRDFLEDLSADFDNLYRGKQAMSSLSKHWDFGALVSWRAEALWLLAELRIAAEFYRLGIPAFANVGQRASFLARDLLLKTSAEVAPFISHSSATPARG